MSAAAAAAPDPLWGFLFYRNAAMTTMTDEVQARGPKQLPEAIIHMIADYVGDFEFDPLWGGRDIDWKLLSRNPAAIDYLTAHTEHVDWEELNRNPAAMPLLAANGRFMPQIVYAMPEAEAFIRADIKKHTDAKGRIRLGWDAENALCMNAAVPDLIEAMGANQQNARYRAANRNPAVLRGLFNEIRSGAYMPHYYVWDALSGNPAALPYIVEFGIRFDYRIWFGMPEAIGYIMEHIWERLAIEWYMRPSIESLSGNPAAIHIILERIEFADWGRLSRNPAALDILAAHPTRIGSDFMLNPGIKIRDSRRVFDALLAA